MRLRERTKLAKLRAVETESDGETEPEAQRDEWRLRQKGGREPPELRVHATHS